MPELVGLVAQGKPVIRRHDLAVLVDGAEGHEIGASAQRADFGHLKRPKAARESELRLIGDVLAAKDQDRMLLESRPRYLVCGVFRRDLGERYAAQLSGKSRTQRDDFHRRPPLRRLLNFSTKSASAQCCRGRSPSRRRSEKADGLRPQLAAALLGILKPYLARLSARQASRALRIACATATDPVELTPPRRRYPGFSDRDRAPPRRPAPAPDARAAAPAGRSFLRCSAARNKSCSPRRSGGRTPVSWSRPSSTRTRLRSELRMQGSLVPRASSAPTSGDSRATRTRRSWD